MSVIENLDINGSDRSRETSHLQKLNCRADSQPSSRQRRLPPLAQTFRVLVLAAEVHSEDKGLEDEGHDDGHHHLAGRGAEKGWGGRCFGPPPPNGQDGWSPG